MKATALRWLICTFFLGCFLSLPPVELQSATKKKSSSSSTSSSSAKRKSSSTAGKTGASAKSSIDQSSLPPEPLPERKPSASPSPSPSASPSPAASATPASTTATLSPDDLIEFSKQPEKVQKLITSALALTQQNLTYKYDSADPAKGGMDCSGFVYYALNQIGVTDAPRQSNEQYVWLRRAGAFRAVLSRKGDTFELDELRPGDLLFWTNTYKVDRDPPVTHTMIYLGREKSTKARVMVGSSDGRSYHGIARNGVSVFDFKPETNSKRDGAASDAPHPQFVGYARVPRLRDE